MGSRMGTQKQVLLKSRVGMSRAWRNDLKHIFRAWRGARPSRRPPVTWTPRRLLLLFLLLLLLLLFCVVVVVARALLTVLAVAAAVAAVDVAPVNR